MVWNAQKLGTTVLSSERIHLSRGKSQTSDSVVAPAASQAAASLSYPAGTSGGAREADKKAVETSFHAGPSSADFEAFVQPSTSTIAPTTVRPSVAPPEDAPVLKSGFIIHPLFRAASAIGDQNAFTKTEAVGDVLSQGSKGRASSPRITTTGAVSHLAPHVDLGSKIKPTAAPSLFASGVTTKTSMIRILRSHKTRHLFRQLSLFRQRRTMGHCPKSRASNLLRHLSPVQAP